MELYRESKEKGIRWLQHSYSNAQDWVSHQESKGRQIARKALDWAHNHVWSGRTICNDKAIFIAHAKIAYRSGKVKYGASARDLAEMAGCVWKTANNATHRLINAGLITLETPAVANLANVYRLTYPGLEEISVANP